MWTCPICNNVQNKKIIIADITWDVSVPGPSRYDVIKCNNCSIELSDPIPCDKVLNEYYSNYEPTQTDINSYRSNELIKLNSSIIEYLLEKKSNSPEDSSFLDYGFGAGAFVINLAQRGLNATAIDYSDQNINQLIQYCIDNKLKIQTYNISKAGLGALKHKRFNFITLFQVIEHLQDPVKTLRDLNSLQDIGDYIYIECPNQGGFFFNVKNKIRPIINRKFMWGSLSPPQHLFGFGIRSLTHTLENSGYSVIEIGSYAVADKIHAPETAYWYPTFWQWLTKPTNWTLYRTAKMLIRIIDYPASKLFNAGGGLYALATKNGLASKK